MTWMLVAAGMLSGATCVVGLTFLSDLRSGNMRSRYWLGYLTLAVLGACGWLVVVVGTLVYLLACAFFWSRE